MQHVLERSQSPPCDDREWPERDSVCANLKILRVSAVLVAGLGSMPQCVPESLANTLLGNRSCLLDQDAAHEIESLTRQMYSRL